MSRRCSISQASNVLCDCHISGSPPPAPFYPSTPPRSHPPCRLPPSLPVQPYLQIRGISQASNACLSQQTCCLCLAIPTSLLPHPNLSCLDPAYLGSCLYYGNAFGLSLCIWPMPTLCQFLAKCMAIVCQLHA